jgi:hypothetical protein
MLMYVYIYLNLNVYIFIYQGCPSRNASADSIEAWSKRTGGGDNRGSIGSDCSLGMYLNYVSIFVVNICIYTYMNIFIYI